MCFFRTGTLANKTRGVPGGTKNGGRGGKVVFEEMTRYQLFERNIKRKVFPIKRLFVQNVGISLLFWVFRLVFFLAQFRVYSAGDASFGQPHSSCFLLGEVQKFAGLVELRWEEPQSPESAGGVIGYVFCRGHVD